MKHGAIPNPCQGSLSNVKDWSMDNDTAKELFFQKKYLESIAVSEKLILAEHGNTSTKYCCAISAISGGYHLKGLAILMGIIEDFLTSPQEMNTDNIVFHCNVAIQLARLSDFYCRKDASLLSQDEKAIVTSFIFAGVRCATMTSKMVDDPKLLTTLPQIEKKLWQLNSQQEASADNLFFRNASPLVLQIEPTNCCNMSCEMCTRSKMQRQRGYLSLETLDNALAGWKDGYAELTITHLVYNCDVSLMFNGTVKLYFLGEPLLHPKLDLLIKRIRKDGIHVGIQTNALLLERDDIRERLLNSTPNSISVSLDGIDKKSYGNIRKQDSLEHCFEGIRKLHKERENAALETKIKIQASTILVSNTTENREKALAFLAPIAECFDDIAFITLNTLHKPKFMDKSGELKQYQKEQHTSSISDQQPLCIEPFQKLNVLWDGTVTPCCNDFDATMQLGNCNKNSIDSIWNNEKTLALHRALLYNNLNNYPLCRKCL